MLNKIHFAVNHRIYTCLALIFVYFVHFIVYEYIELVVKQTLLSPSVYSVLRWQAAFDDSKGCLILLDSGVHLLLCGSSHEENKVSWGILATMEGRAWDLTNLIDKVISLSGRIMAKQALLRLLFSW